MVADAARDGGDMTQPWKKDLYRREGKGRRCCLEDRIYSIPCRVIGVFPQNDMKKRINCTRMILTKE